MIEDMTARNLDAATQRGYIRSVRACCRYCGRRPEQLTYEDVRRFQLQLMQSGLAPGTVNSALVGLRFFFRTTLRRPEALDYIPMAREPQRLPVVLTQGEVASLLEAAPGLKWRTALSVPMARVCGRPRSSAWFRNDDNGVSPSRPGSGEQSRTCVARMGRTLAVAGGSVQNARRPTWASPRTHA